MLDGLAGWFDCRLCDDVHMTNSPAAGNSLDRPQAFLPIEAPVGISAGERVEVTIMARHLDNVIGWVVELPGSQQRFEHTTFNGLLLDRAALTSWPAGPGREAQRAGPRAADRIVLLRRQAQRLGGAGNGRTRPPGALPEQAGGRFLHHAGTGMGYERVIRHMTLAARPQKDTNSEPFHRFVFPDRTVWTEFYRDGLDYLLRFPGLADFEVSGDGKEILAYPAGETDAATVEHLCINQVVPLALSRQGVPTFHASVVTVPGGAVAFLGKAGMGKSTLAASFALNESQFLTDDSLIIEEHEDACLALPSHASLRLWDDSVAALIDDETKRAAAISYTNKARLLAGDALGYRSEPEPLLAAFLLEQGTVDGVAIRALKGVERQMAWVNNSFLLDIEDAGLLAQHFDWTHRIARSVPTFALDYPRAYGMLDKVRNAIREHVAGLQTSMNPYTRLSVPPHVMARLVEDETVLLDLESGIYFGLEGVGKLIWESIGAGLTLGETAGKVIAEYEVDAAKALDDVFDFAEDLVKRGLLAQ